MVIKIIFSYVIPIATVFFAIYFSKKTNLIKDECNCDVKPYSFARTQLLWWTLITFCCFSIYFGFHNEIPELNPTCLALLGISLGTSATARIIDNTDINNSNIDRHQNKITKKGFLNNILSDSNGISVHRFQAFIFNVLFGIIFLIHFFPSGAFDDFDSYQLGLMGISSAAYVGVKISENNQKPPTS